jgi:hypothetical protein
MLLSFPKLRGSLTYHLLSVGWVQWLPSEEDSMGGESNFPVEKPENISHMIKINNNNSKSSQA